MQNLNQVNSYCLYRKGDKQMSTISQNAIGKENQRGNRTKVPNLIRWAGLSAVGAGIIFAVIQPIHPADEVASVTTTAWAIITTSKLAMCFLFLAGIVGIYARQAKEAGKLGLAGFFLLSFTWWVQTGFVFAEAFIFPVVANTTPQFVDGLLASISGRGSNFNLGALPAIYSVMGLFYMLGGLLFGIATFRANILPRWAAALLAAASALTPLASLLPHQIQRFAAVPVGLALAGLGYALWSERRSRVAENVPGSVQLSQTATE
jgi:hypothetical protein